MVPITEYEIWTSYPIFLWSKLILHRWPPGDVKMTYQCYKDTRMYYITSPWTCFVCVWVLPPTNIHEHVKRSLYSHEMHTFVYLKKNLCCGYLLKFLTYLELDMSVIALSHSWVNSKKSVCCNIKYHIFSRISWLAYRSTPLF